MRWTDDGIFLTGRPYGETSVIADVFTRANGRNLGLVKGGRSRRLRPLLQTGNGLRVEWRARLEEQLGVYTVELAEATAARALDDELSLAGVTALASLLQVLPERDPHPKLFETALHCLGAVGQSSFAASVVYFELRFLEELGFGLDLSKCAATGSTEDLAYVSPKSGQAVGLDAGEPYRDKLLLLPAFLVGEAAPETYPPSATDLSAGLALTGYFLREHVFAAAGHSMPKAREAFARRLQQKAVEGASS